MAAGRIVKKNVASPRMRRHMSVELLRYRIVPRSSVDVFHTEEQKTSETLIEGAQGMVCCRI